jgi:hypothetical protein
MLDTLSSAFTNLGDAGRRSGEMPEQAGRSGRRDAAILAALSTINDLGSR